MDYKKHYKRLIETRLNRTPIKGEYYEKHHIIPKCWGGSNKKENIVKLTGREHYIAHWLLYRMRPHSEKVSLAFWMMSYPGSKYVERNYRISSRAYSEAKQAMADANRRLNTGRKVKPEYLVKWKGYQYWDKIVVNIVTGEEFKSAKECWRVKFSNYITYSSFNYYMRGKIKNNGKPAARKVPTDDIYNWKYKKDLK
jgi:hypothetical protein